MKKSVDLNCDMGEGLANDALIMPYISSANIACGYHAGNEAIMKRTVELAMMHQVKIGAHPGFADRLNFGRLEMKLSNDALNDLISEQIFLLQKITTALGTNVTHIKPHGALYNMSAKDLDIAYTIAKLVYGIDPHLVLFGLSGSYSISEAKKCGLKTASEVFADRTYQDDGSLTSRSLPNAMIESEADSIQQVLIMIQDQKVMSVNGKSVPIIADTICIHGDGSHAVQFARNIFHQLKAADIELEKK